MKKKVLISLLAAVCVLWLTACAKAPEQAAESKEDTTVSQQSEVIPTDTKIEASPVSQPEELNPLTLEQVKTIIKDSESARDKSGGRIAYIREKLDEIQKFQLVKAYRPSVHVEEAELTYYLFDDSGRTNGTVVVTRPYCFVLVNDSSGNLVPVEDEMVVLHRTYDSNGEVSEEEVLWNFFDDKLAINYMTVEKFQEIVATARAEGRSNRWIYEELEKIQQPNTPFLYLVNPKYPGRWYTYLMNATADTFEYIAWEDVHSGENMPTGSMDGDFIVYRVKQGLYGDILEKEILYDVREESSQQNA